MKPLSRPMVDRGQKEQSAWQWLVVSIRTVLGNAVRTRFIESAITYEATEPMVPKNVCPNAAILIPFAAAAGAPISCAAPQSAQPWI